MISLLIIFSLSFLPNLIHTSVPFTLNPGCDLIECKETGYPALYYGSHVVDDKAVHIVYSSVDELTISIFQTAKNDSPIFDYDALFARNYSGAITFKDKIRPANSFSIVLRRLFEFNDTNDNGRMDDGDHTIITYFLRDIETNNDTFRYNVTNQPQFQIPFQFNSSLNIDILYPGETIRDSKFPKLKTAPNSFFINIALQGNNYTEPNTRFALEYYLMLINKEGSKMFSSRFIDDQFTPGIFNVWQLKSLSDMYPYSMLWKPVVYQSKDRTIEQNTLMQIYSLKNIAMLDNNTDGIFHSILSNPNVAAFNVSLGQAKDGFFSKTNYTFIQFTAGLDLLEPDSTKAFVSIALIISLALPAVVGIIAIIFIVKRRFSPRQESGYDTIQD